MVRAWAESPSDMGSNPSCQPPAVCTVLKFLQSLAHSTSPGSANHGVTLSILQMRTLRPREGRCIVPGHTANWGQSWYWNLGLLISLPHLVLALPPASMPPPPRVKRCLCRADTPGLEGNCSPCPTPCCGPHRLSSGGGAGDWMLRGQGSDAFTSPPRHGLKMKQLPLSHQVAFGLDYRHNYL